MANRNLKKIGYDETSELSDLEPTPKKKQTKLRRSYAIADIAAASRISAENEHEPQYEAQSLPERHQDYATELEDFSDNEPTPKKQKTMKVPVRESIMANRKQHQGEPSKAPENKVLYHC